MVQGVRRASHPDIQSLANSLTRLGHEFEWVRDPSDMAKADKLLFPGVGAFGTAMEALSKKGYLEPLRAYIKSCKPYMLSLIHI